MHQFTNTIQIVGVMSATQWWEFLKGCVFSLVANNPSPAAQRLRSRLYDTECKIDTGVAISNPNNFSCGKECALYHGTCILNGHGDILMGEKSHLGAMCYVNVHYGSLRIGNNVAIGPHTDIIVYSNDYRVGKKVTECRTQEDVWIGSNVFVGAGCVILPGSQVGNNVVIRAGSVVKGSLEGNGLYAGSPCEKIKEGWYQ